VTDHSSASMRQRRQSDPGDRRKNRIMGVARFSRGKKER
jgi:hypothetical protein